MAPGPTISEKESFFRVAQEPNLDPAGGVLAGEFVSFISSGSL
jgi:hypothetical protein